MSRTEPLGSIIIVGGGTAGWMTAAYLGRRLGPLGCSITLVESASTGTIGVGEATIPSLVRYLRTLGLPQDEFLVRCSATYKLGIRFSDWIGDGQDYWHPFGLCGGRIDNIDLFHFWLRRRLAGDETSAYAHYSLQALLCREAKAPRSVSGGSPVMDSGSYAFHLDASAFAAYLRERSVASGVEHLFDDVTNVVRDENGHISAIETVGGRSLAADLYIDCSGFAGVLIGKGLDEPWIDWSDTLLCDRAVTLPLPRDEEMAPFTRSTALSAGWMWQIPLSHRTGAGYVYSSRHASPEQAADELMSRVKLKRPRAADMRHLKMRIGRRRRFWVGNCIAVGLAGGFVEPLESTGIHFIQAGMEFLMEFFPDRRCDRALRDAYNREMAALYDEVRDFILLHYVLARREESFWRDARAVPLPPSLEKAIALYDEAGVIDPRSTSLFGEPSRHFIFSGSGRLPRRPEVRAMLPDANEVGEILRRIRDQNERAADELPLHRALVGWLHRPPL